MVSTVVISTCLERIYLGAAWGEIGSHEGNENKREFGPGECVVVVVEKDADRDVQQDAHHDAHNKALQGLVGRNEKDIA